MDQIGAQKRKPLLVWKPEERAASTAAWAFVELIVV